MVRNTNNRRKPRFTVRDLTLSLNGKTYRVFNINEHGVGFLIDEPQEIDFSADGHPILINVW